MQYTTGVGRSAAALVTAVAAATALMTGCTPAGDDGAVSKPSASPAASQPVKPTPAATPTPTGGASSGGRGTGGGGTGGGTKACTIDQIKASAAHQADVRPPGTGTGAAIVSVTNSSRQACTLRGYPTVAGAGHGSPDKNLPLTVTPSGSAATVSLVPGARAWTKLTFANVQGEADGYCASGATPAAFPTLVLGVPGAGAHQIAMDDGVFALCDDKATATAFSPTEPS
ncbi:DUF4232 domain-containing protein [Streptomyces subrutilus]|uniref:DUF4232 domain-containing protein n=1 Tax=Streptomyces subrutilus TaxID=36818 RepID=A0A1E5PLU6_9ACTN|nr:DUF4232 domain-containing protein [Streptomyces subrutilus]OEJ30541.1 hypothetical protein BGK67_03500 [Streptomyces subrutilus]